METILSIATHTSTSISTSSKRRKRTRERAGQSRRRACTEPNIPSRSKPTSPPRLWRLQHLRLLSPQTTGTASVRHTTHVISSQVPTVSTVVAHTKSHTHTFPLRYMSTVARGARKRIISALKLCSRHGTCRSDERLSIIQLFLPHDQQTSTTNRMSVRVERSRHCARVAPVAECQCGRSQSHCPTRSYRLIEQESE